MLCCRRIPLTKHTILPSSHLPQLPRTTFLQKAFLLRSSQLSLHQRRYTSTSPPKPPLAARIVSSLPARAKPYAYLARLDKPVGSWLLYWPCGPSPLSRTYTDDCSLEYNPRRRSRAYPCPTIVVYVGPLWRRCSSHAWRRMYHQ